VNDQSTETDALRREQRSGQEPGHLGGPGELGITCRSSASGTSEGLAKYARRHEVPTHHPVIPGLARSNFVDLMSTAAGLAGARHGIAVIGPAGRTPASTREAIPERKRKVSSWRRNSIRW
jgi:hypothetical protein